MKTRNWKNDGRAFEKELEVIATVYQSRGVMRFRKIDPPHRVFKKFNPKTQAMEPTIIFQSNPWLDYVGAWTERGGTFLSFEAKSTSEDRLPAFGSSGFSENQWRNYKHWSTAGGVLFLLWRCPAGTFFFGQSELARVEQAGRKSLKPEDGIKVEQGLGFVTCDFAATLRAVDGEKFQRIAIQEAESLFQKRNI